jgi:hypothetical protein
MKNLKNAILFAAGLGAVACSSDPAARRAATPAARRASAPAPAARCGDGFTRALTSARFTGGSRSCAKTPHVDVLVRDALGQREVEYQLLSSSIDDACGPLPDASVIELGRMFSTMTAKNAPDMPA